MNCQNPACGKLIPTERLAAFNIPPVTCSKECSRVLSRIRDRDKKRRKRARAKTQEGVQ